MQVRVQCAGCGPLWLFLLIVLRLLLSLFFSCCSLVGSLCRAQLKCWEARQVLDVDGTEKAFEVLKEASCSLEKVQDKSSDSYMLSKGLHLHFKGKSTGGKETTRKP